MKLVNYDKTYIRAMSVTKDYYRILNVKASAPVNEIKNAYRKLALKYHPDRNPDDALAAAIFTDAAEAYAILSDVESRKKYNYSRPITAEQEYKKPVETIERLIHRINEINKHIKTIDPFRFNKDALLYSLKQLLPDDIDLLSNTSNDLTKKFLEMICEAAKYLSSYQTKQLILLLQPLFNKNEWLQFELHTLMHQQQKQESWEKNKIILVVLLAIVICIVIFFAAKK